MTDIAASLDRSLLLERLADLVRHPSENPPGNEAEVAGLVASYCREIGLDVTTVEAEPGRPSVIARFGDGARPRVAYCTHIDVVPAGDRAAWASDPFAAEIRDGRLHGRGACDAKGCLAAALEAARILIAAPGGPQGTLELMFVADEETMGFKGAGYLKDLGLLDADVAIVGEPTSLRVVIAQRGANWLRITTRGVAAHGSAPERGVNAITHMAELILRLEETMPEISHEVLGGPSLNVGTIFGGEKVNVVPASCTIELDRRSIPGETGDEILAQIAVAIDRARRRFPDLEANVAIAFAGQPFEVEPSARVVQEVSGAVAEVTGYPAELLGFRGASDARFFAESGAETVLCGPGDIALAHTARESVAIDEVERAALIYALAFGRLLGAEAR